MPRIPLTLLLVSSLTLVQPVSVAAQEAAATPEDAPETVTETPAGLEILPAAGIDLDAYLWEKRVLVIFADTPADPRFIKQMEMIGERPRDLLERDVVVLTDTDPEPRTDVRKTLRPRGFALVLVDKDGEVKLRKPAPWSTREIARSIDKTPLRRQEIRDRSGSIGQ
ncbi:DUF4174 domain-containing protein [Tropicimonas sp. TH_r6]|uniref:DUF4174 domain-containing protein n=1 Tax=Tropicimonas sp. TH_r6 TaxID=3082085 RepID=UPI002953DC42|nr:DUF4174 domain-containing protein [Tropicimonas sp. TH_r6]MDV7145261.1 DUF4174 domain-containing protein [Tropicimonas sp. TH_r6]